MALEVLVVDDEADIRELVSGVLEDEGFTVRAAADSTAALEAIEERRPSLVLLDVRMPVMDGIETARRIREKHAATVIVLVSVDDVASVPDSIVSCGASAFVRKQDFGRAVLQRLWAVHGRPKTV